MTHRTEHVVRIGSVYRPNDSQWAFEVIALVGRYAHVCRLDRSHARRILVDYLRPSNSKHGYSLLELGPEPS